MKTKTYITTDTHLGHSRMVEFGRPVDFEERILKELKVIGKKDILVHLGDLAFGPTSKNVEKFCKAVRKNCVGWNNNAAIILVLGNHDKKKPSWYWDNYNILAVDELVVTVGGKRVLLSHRPRLKRKDVDYNIHGHTHGNAHRDKEHAPHYDERYNLELALENTNYKPVVLEDFIRAKTQKNDSRLRSNTASRFFDEALCPGSGTVQFFRALCHHRWVDYARNLFRPSKKDRQGTSDDDERDMAP